MNIILMPPPIIRPRKRFTTSRARKPSDPKVIILVRLQVRRPGEVLPTDITLEPRIINHPPPQLCKRCQRPLPASPLAAIVWVKGPDVALAVLGRREAEGDVAAAVHRAVERAVVAVVVVLSRGVSGKALVEVFTGDPRAFE